MSPGGVTYEASWQITAHLNSAGLRFLTLHTIVSLSAIIHEDIRHTDKELQAGSLNQTT